MPQFTKPSKTTLFCLFTLVTLSFAGSLVQAEPNEEPVSVSQWKNDGKPVAEVDEISGEEIAAYLTAKHEAEGTEEAARMVFDPAMAAGKIIIRVHKSSNPAKAEFLEVFRQKSANPNDLEPINLFDGGSSNQALVSTAGMHNGRMFTTPDGTFNIDTMEVMHHSHKYDNAPMPWSMFFMASTGIAIHGATPSEFGDLGKKASHGCVRVHPTNAKLLFDLVKKEGQQNAIIQVQG
jgi:L,D-transpeptidase catalytic domain